MVKEGELWLLGKHRLLCGDSLAGVAMGHLLKGEAVAMVWTDPPYIVDYTGKAGNIKNDKMPESRLEAFLYEAFVQMREALRPGGAIMWPTRKPGAGWPLGRHSDGPGSVLPPALSGKRTRR